MSLPILIYGRLTFFPKQFPSIVETRVDAFDRTTNEELGWDVEIEPNRSWDWIRSHYSALTEDWELMTLSLLKGERTYFRIALWASEIEDVTGLPMNYERAISLREP